MKDKKRTRILVMMSTPNDAYVFPTKYSILLRQTYAYSVICKF